MLFDNASAPGWSDWVGLILSAVGFTFTIIALIVASKQLKKTQTATEAVNERLLEARERLSADQLAAVLQQLTTVVADMDFALDNNDRGVAHRALLRFSYVAHEAIGLLDSGLADHSLLQERLVTASSLALDIKGNIMGSRTTDIARHTKKLSKDISRLTSEISGLVARGRYKLGETSDV